MLTRSGAHRVGHARGEGGGRGGGQGGGVAELVKEGGSALLLQSF